MLELPQIRARIQRLEALGEGLAEEGKRWRNGEDPLHHTERRLYLTGILDALVGVEEARSVLLRVVNRLEHRSTNA
jgi:hypothetical protein